MASINKVILIGNLGRDPELRYTQSGQAVANFSLATTDRFSNREGERQERTEWHRVTVWGKTAENCAQYLNKGRSVEVIAQTVQFLGGRGQSTGAPAGGGEGGGGDFREETPPQGDDIPF
jgi:single-strand DNA-binding protein